MALSKKLAWVKVDRDRSPALVKKFGVRSYPSLLLLGDKDEKVHRFSGFKKPRDFLAQLAEGLKRHALYKGGKKWDVPDPRPAAICDDGTVETFAAPSEKIPNGLTFLAGSLWIAQQGELCKLDIKTGKTVRRFEIPERVRDLCTDGKSLYGMEYGWTAGQPIHVIDPATGKVTRSIVTEENKKNRSMGAMGIAWARGKLYVLSGMRGEIFELNPASGAIERKLVTGAKWLSGLCFDGQHFVAASRDKLHVLDGETGVALRNTKLNYPVRALAAHEGALYLMEQPVFGHDKNHKRVRVWPKKTLVHVLRTKSPSQR